MSSRSIKEEQSNKQGPASNRSIGAVAKSAELKELSEEIGEESPSERSFGIGPLTGASEVGEEYAVNEDLKEEDSDEETAGEEDVDYDLLALELQSPPSTTFSELAGKVNVTPLRDKPVYRNVLKYVKTMVEELVNKNTENVLCHFGEWSMRVIDHLKNTYGIPQELFLPTANNYIYTVKSYTFGWKDAIEEYLHEYGPEIMGEDLLDKLKIDGIDEEEDGEDAIKTIEDVVIKDDDWDEGGYRHYLDRKKEPKEPPFDEFEYVTLEQQAFFDEVGIGLPKHERFEIHMALFRLTKVRNLTNVRFWGKIFGLYQDYYIAEAVMKPDDMKYDDFDDLPEYEESEYVGEWCEELLIEEVEDEAQPEMELEPEEIGELLDEDISEEHGMTEAYGEYYGEYDEEEALIKPKPSIEPVAGSVTFDSFQLEPPLIPDDELELGEEMLGEQESVFELEVDDGKFKGKMTLKNYKLPQLPRIKEKPIKLPPPEEPGEGTNKFVFFVTNDPKSDWIRLPHVTPEQIVVARQIRKFFTGYLTSRVNSFPKFPGIEMNLLRAQIARISAGTQVSPAGYFRFDEGEEADDAFDIAAGQGGKIILNRDFEPLTVKDLTDPTCTFWVHHTAHILKQGRTVWYNVNQKGPKERIEGMEDEEEGEEAPPFKDVMGEKGPPLLTSCAEDLFMEAVPPWTVKPAIELAPHEGCVYVRSNLWPGSYSFAFGRKIGFMYHGWGMKAVSYGYTPPPPYLPMKEYPLGPDIIEITDPTPYQEEEYRLKLAEWLKKREQHPMPMGEGEGGEGEGADEDEE